MHSSDTVRMSSVPVLVKLLKVQPHMWGQHVVSSYENSLGNLRFSPNQFQSLPVSRSHNKARVIGSRGVLFRIFHCCYLYSLLFQVCHCINIYSDWLGEPLCNLSPNIVYILCNHSIKKSNWSTDYSLHCKL
jgi:hypothetical protein